jgi:hypothetical protein
MKPVMVGMMAAAKRTSKFMMMRFWLEAEKVEDFPIQTPSQKILIYQSANALMMSCLVRMR